MIVPAILAYNKQAFQKYLRHLEKHTKYIQIDIADGKFVASKTWHNVRQIKKMLPKDIKIEIHLMVKNPEKFAKKWKKIPQLQTIIFHSDAVKNITKTVRKLKKYKKNIIVAINPEVHIKTLFPVLLQIDGVQFMTVFPGKQGQTFLQPVIEKIENFHEKFPEVPLSADGGINEKNIQSLKKAGIEKFCIGSGILHGDVKKNYLKIEKALKNRK